MYHDATLSARAAADPRPRSAVSAGVGLAGLAGAAAWMLVAEHRGLDGPYAALVNVAACGAPMVLWSLLVDRVHRSPSTGIDWARARPWREALGTAAVKLVGLWATWAAIAAVYCIGRFWWQSGFAFAMWCLGHAAPVLVAVSVPYVLWLDRYLVEPRDGSWHLGAWLLRRAHADPTAIVPFLRAWAVKAFFLPFMLAIVPPGFGEVVRTDWHAALGDPVRLSSWLCALMFTLDAAFATVGYLLTLRPLDSHIRSANPFAAAWTAALVCYPPFILMSDGGPLDYHPGTGDWTRWFAGHPVLLAATGAVLVALTGFYAWATVAFGVRFSNLTNRGILTHGPYAVSRHPAYLAKNLFWWLSTIPFLTTGTWHDAVRATALLAVVSGVYWWRAKTEERHLSLDPDYVAYWQWMERHGAVPKMFRFVWRRRA